MSLLNQSQQLQAQVEEYLNNQYLEQIALKLQSVKEFFLMVEEQIGILSEQLLLIKADTGVSPNDDLINTANKFNELLTSANKVSLDSLNQASEYKKLKVLLPKLQSLLENQVVTAWNDHNQRLIPELQDGIQEDLGDNKKVLMEFGDAKTKFDRLSRKIPTTSEQWNETVAELDQLSTNMKAAKAKLKTNCPDYMRAFFDDVSSGFDLTKLTPQMLQWLQQKGEASRFEVKRVTNSYF